MFARSACLLYSKTCVKRPLKNCENKDLKIKTGSLMKVESIAECSPWSILQYFWTALSDNWSWKPFFGLFESSRFTQAYCICLLLDVVPKALCYITLSLSLIFKKKDGNIVECLKFWQVDISLNVSTKLATRMFLQVLLLNLTGLGSKFDWLYQVGAPLYLASPENYVAITAAPVDG